MEGLGGSPPLRALPRRKPVATGSQGWIAPVFPEFKAVQRAAGAKSCLAVHSFEAALRWARLPRKFRGLNACRIADFAVRRAHGRSAVCHERSSNQRFR